MNSYPQPRLFPALGWKWTLFFIIVALVEIYLLTMVNARIGFGSTTLLILFSGFGGVCLMRWEGNRCWNRILRELSAGKPAVNSMKDGILIIIGGFMLIMPGVLTDLLGLALFFPPFRILVRYLFMKNVSFQLPGSTFTFSDAFMNPGGGQNGANSGGAGFPFGNFYMGGFSETFNNAAGQYSDNSDDGERDYGQDNDQNDPDIYDSEYSPHADSMSDPDRPIQIIDVEAKKPDE